jgi:uncharacterized Zn finger protein (UPF0148 family)
MSGPRESLTPMAPIMCAGCGVALALSVEPTITCRHCQAVATVPPEYREAVAMQQQARAARAASEPRFRALALGSAQGWQTAAAASLVVLPPLATAIGRFGLGLGPVEAQALLMLPSIFVAVSLWTGATTARRLTSSFQSEMAARPPASPDQESGCRACGAPLPRETGGAQLSATCGYCGTESLLIELPSARLRADQRHARRSLAQASEALRRRMRWLALGVVGAGVTAALVAAALLTTLAPG